AATRREREGEDGDAEGGRDETPPPPGQAAPPGRGPLGGPVHPCILAPRTTGSTFGVDPHTSLKRWLRARGSGGRRHSVHDVGHLGSSEGLSDTPLAGPRTGWGPAWRRSAERCVQRLD